MMVTHSVTMVHLSYNNVYFRNGRLGIGDSNPSVSLDSNGDARFGTTSRSGNTYVRALRR